MFCGASIKVHVHILQNQHQYGDVLRRVWRCFFIFNGIESLAETVNVWDPQQRGQNT